ncbi:winged helix-turn-helix domain-containing protein [Shewanella algae]|uniref:winged helix-turn-helix domain-containing protein n=1 Tax=Shewanella algae TaxID=38313 RepID=UPI001685DFBF|nr:crosslink repair DNA glycosylase YcaQ family protein [Shewanella algae]QNV06834.1 winged helix-turn-helix domain-containing protein [Shewanella algae]
MDTPLYGPLTIDEWLRLNLQRQGLLQPAASAASVIRQLGYVQIDSINVVERAHHHVLHSRLPGYHPEHLQQAIAAKEVFEYWAHAAAYLPMSDYRYSLQRKRQLSQGDKHWFEPDEPLMREVLARVRAEGPLKASDFEHPSDQRGSWWDWKPAKKALEQLFMRGELMVVRRERFQKVYDLAERVLPPGIDTRVPDDDEFGRYLVNRFLNANGFGSEAQFAYLRKGMRPVIKRVLAQGLEAGELQRFKVDGQQYFCPAELSAAPMIPERVWLLNPFDNLVIQRNRLKQWFGFDYQLEVYLPQEKRIYGYYSLAILWRQQFIGRVDVKADRPRQCLLLQNLVLEPEYANRPLDDMLLAELARAIADYARFNACERWKLVRSNHKGLKQLWRRQQWL